MQNIPTTDTDEVTAQSQVETDLTDQQPEAVPTNSQELSVTPDEQPNAEGTEETTTEAKPEDEETKEPEKTPEELKAERDAENARKGYEGKMSKLEREVNERRQANLLERELLNNPEETLTALVSNRAKFEKLRPYLAEKNETWNITYDDFVTKLKTEYEQQSQENPESLVKANKIEVAKQQAIQAQQFEYQSLEKDIKYELMADIPEFKASLRNPETAQLAEADFKDALNIAEVRFKRMARNGEDPDGLTLIREALIEQNPNWKTSKIISTTAKAQAKSDVKQILKESASTNGNSQSKSPVSLTPEQTTKKEAFINFLVNECQNSKEEAIIKANQINF